MLERQGDRREDLKTDELRETWKESRMRKGENKKADKKTSREGLQAETGRQEETDRKGDSQADRKARIQGDKKRQRDMVIRRHGDRETRRQGDKETGRRGDRELGDGETGLLREG